jgi:hypothetical protein
MTFYSHNPSGRMGITVYAINESDIIYYNSTFLLFTCDNIHSVNAVNANYSLKQNIIIFVFPYHRLRI